MRFEIMDNDLLSVQEARILAETRAMRRRRWRRFRKADSTPLWRSWQMLFAPM